MPLSSDIFLPLLNFWIFIGSYIVFYTQWLTPHHSPTNTVISREKILAELFMRAAHNICLHCILHILLDLAYFFNKFFILLFKLEDIQEHLQQSQEETVLYEKQFTDAKVHLFIFTQQNF